MIMVQIPQPSDMSVRNDIESLAKNVRSIKAYENVTPLPDSFRPGPVDVICARGKRAFNHSGNRRFRALIEAHMDKYKEASSKIEKSVIVSSIVDSIREASPNGGFVKEEGGRWFEVGDHNAREKIGQSFRDLLHYKYRSSTKAKKQRRKELQSHMGGDTDDSKKKDERVVPKIKHLRTNSDTNPQGIAPHADANLGPPKTTNVNRHPHLTNQLKLVPDQLKELQESELKAGPVYVPSMSLSSALYVPCTMNAGPNHYVYNRPVWNQSFDESQAYVSRAMFDAPLAMGGPRNQLHRYHPADGVEEEQPLEF